MNTKIGFKSMMFVYCAEEAYNPSKLKVFVPDVFLTGNSPGLSETKSQKGNTSIFVNAAKSDASGFSKNYTFTNQDDVIRFSKNKTFDFVKNDLDFCDMK